MKSYDSSHDFQHVFRVWKLSKLISQEEQKKINEKLEINFQVILFSTSINFLPKLKIST